MPDYRTRALAAALLCGLIGIVSLYFSVLTNRSRAVDEYFRAREYSRLARVWANAAIWFVLVALSFFGSIALLDAIGAS